MTHLWNVLYSLPSCFLRLKVAVWLQFLAILSSPVFAADLSVRLLSAKEAQQVPFETVKPKKKIKVTVLPQTKLKPLVVKNESIAPPPVVCPKGGFHGNLLIHHIQLPGGDSTFMRTPSGITILVGAGPKMPPRTPHPVIEVLRTCYQLKTIDYFVATHYSPAQLGGLPQILKKYRFKSGVIRNHHVAGWDKKKFGLKDENEIKNPDHVQFQVLEAGTSLGLVVRYGTFDYFMGGDSKSESQVADIVGDVDVIQTDLDPNGSSFSKLFVETLNPERVVINSREFFSEDHPLMKKLHSVASVRQSFQVAQQKDIFLLADLNSYRVGRMTFATDGLVGSGLITESAAIETYLPQTKLTGGEADSPPLEEPDMDALKEE